jgi:putative molybdopterin biosynthesis protein
LEERVSEKVVKAQRGGEAGGGAVLTEAGARLLEEYKAIEEKVAKFLGAGREFRMLDVKSPDLAIIGSSCIGVKILASMIEGFSVEVVEVGSTAGIAALMLGEADVAGIHILDEKTGAYNVDALGRLWPDGDAVLVRGYVREQGLMVGKGNPKGITGVRDLERGDVRLINRNAGAGTRMLLDMLLREHCIDVRRVRGYNHEVRTHEEVAKAVLAGGADVGLGLMATASEFGLTFLKIRDEVYDFAISKRRLAKPSVKNFLSVLRSKRFAEELEKWPGLHALPETGEIIADAPT